MAEATRIIGGLGLALVAMAALPALANPAFPPELVNVGSLSYTPPCTVCHNNPNGGIGTAVQPFAISMKAHGLTDPKVFTVDSALKAERADHTDSNNDGVDDWDSLQMGLDPNTGLSFSGPNPVYGCGGRIAGDPRPAGALAAIVAGGMVWLLGRGKARSRRCASPTTPR